MTSPPAPPPSTPDAAGPVARRATRAARLAALVVMLEALVLLGLAAFYVYGIVSRGTSDTARAVTSGLLILVFAAGLLVLARGWAQAKDWPRTPTLLWNVLLLPAAWSLWQAERPLPASAVLVLAGTAAAAALAAPPRQASFEDREPPATIDGAGSD